MHQPLSNRFCSAALAAILMFPAAAVAQAPAAAPADSALRAAIAAPTRTPANTARDPHRHPAETLAFFGIKPADTVVEIWPGGGWYTEILAPYVAQGGGTLYVVPPEGRGAEGIRTKLAGNPQAYGAVKVAPLPGTGPSAVPDGSVDLVLTFRNVHNWTMGEKPFGDRMFAEMFRMLKPGGTLGIVDHRLPESADSAREKTSGYMKPSTVRALAEAAGFRFAGASEVNANPKDTADWPNGVWTLPPTFALKDQDREKYAAIGESDRMTLKFVKPQ